MADTPTLETTTPDQTAQIAPVAAQPAPAVSMGAPPASPAQPDDQAQPDAGGGQTIAGPDEQPQYQSIGMKVLHGVLGALGGTSQTTYTVDPATHQLTATQIPIGPGMQFKRIIAGALSGLAAGGAAGPGPGHTQRALALGVGGGQQQAQQQDQQARQTATEDYDRQQKSLLTKAQLAASTVDTAKNAFALTRMQGQATEDESASQNNWSKTLQDAGDGVRRFPIFKNMDDVVAQEKTDPVLAKAAANGTLMTHVAYGADHKIVGLEAAIVPPAWLDAKTSTDQKIAVYEPNPDDPNGAPVHSTQTIAAGTMTNGQVQVIRSAQNKQQQDYLVKQQEMAQQTKLANIHEQGEDRRASMTQAGEVEAAKIRSGGVGGLPQDDAGQIDMSKVPQSDQMIMRALSNGSDLQRMLGRKVTAAEAKYYEKGAMALDPTMVNSPTGARQKAYIDLTDSNGTGAKQILSYNTTLGHLSGVADAVQGLRNTKSPLINKPLNELQHMARGNPALTTLLVPLIAARTEAMTFLNSGHALHKEDAEEGRKALNDSMSPAEMDAGVKGFAHTVAVRAGEINEQEKAVFGGRTPVPVLHPKGVQALQRFGMGKEAQEMSSGPSTTPAPAPAGQVSVQIPGSPPGFISQAALAQFQKDHPNAKVMQ